MGASKADQKLGDNIITIDRRRGERRTGQPDALDAKSINPPQQKKQRRRHIDPTTCERDYSDHEIEFMRAMDDYKRDSGRMFPTCSEVLEVIRSLGYHKLSDSQAEELGFCELETTAESDFQDDQELEDDVCEKEFVDA